MASDAVLKWCVWVDTVSRAWLSRETERRRSRTFQGDQTPPTGFEVRSPYLGSAAPKGDQVSSSAFR
jgi:hypothetical protein